MSTSRSSKNDSSTSENESLSENEVSERSQSAERKPRASSHQHQYRNPHQPRHNYYAHPTTAAASHLHHHQLNPQQYSNGKSQSKTFARNFIIDQQTLIPPSGQSPQLNPSVRYYIAPDPMPSNNIPMRATPNLAPGYYQIKEGGNVMPSVQACGPQYVFDNYAYKPGFTYTPATYSGGVSMQPTGSGMQQQQQMYSTRNGGGDIKCLPIHRSSEHLDSMGAVAASGGPEFISIKYISPMGHAGSRLIKGETPIGGGMVCNAPNGRQPSYSSTTNQAFHFLPSGGSQHSLNNFPTNFINPYPNMVQSSYRMINNYDIIQQQMIQQQLAMATAARKQKQEQSQTETDTTGEESDAASSTLGSSRGCKEKKDNGSTTGGVATPITSATPPPQQIAMTTPTSTGVKSTVKSGAVNKTVTTTRINKPVSTNWVLTGGARSGLTSRADARGNFLRSTNGYYDDSVNDRVMLGGTGKQSTKKKFFKIFGITSLVSFVVIALVLGSVFGVMYGSKNSIVREETARMFGRAQNITEPVVLNGSVLIEPLNSTVLSSTLATIISNSIIPSTATMSTLGSLLIIPDNSTITTESAILTSTLLLASEEIKENSTLERSVKLTETTTTSSLTKLPNMASIGISALESTTQKTLEISSIETQTISTTTIISTESSSTTEPSTTLAAVAMAIELTTEATTETSSTLTTDPTIELTKELTTLIINDDKADATTAVLASVLVIETSTEEVITTTLPQFVDPITHAPSELISWEFHSTTAIPSTSTIETTTERIVTTAKIELLTKLASTPIIPAARMISNEIKTEITDSTTEETTIVSSVTTDLLTSVKTPVTPTEESISSASLTTRPDADIVLDLITTGPIIPSNSVLLTSSA